MRKSGYISLLKGILYMQHQCETHVYALFNFSTYSHLWIGSLTPLLTMLAAGFYNSVLQRVLQEKINFTGCYKLFHSLKITLQNETDSTEVFLNDCRYKTKHTGR